MDYLTPDIDDKDLLIDILLRFCNSNLIARVLGTWLVIWIERQESYKEIYPKTIIYTSPLAFGYYYRFSKAYILQHVDFEKFPFQVAPEARENKTTKIHIEPEELAKIRLHDYSSVKECKHINLLPVGLKGVEKAIKIIQSAYNEDINSVPYYFFAGEGKIVNFRLQAHVIWNSWLHFIQDKTEKEIVKYLGTEGDNVIDLIKNEENIVEIDTNEKKVLLGRWNESDEYSVDIDRFIQENWDNKFERKHSLYY